jgi:hypothetical protein
VNPAAPGYLAPEPPGIGVPDDITGTGAGPKESRANPVHPKYITEKSRKTEKTGKNNFFITGDLILFFQYINFLKILQDTRIEKCIHDK